MAVIPTIDEWRLGLEREPIFWSVVTKQNYVPRRPPHIWNGKGTLHNVARQAHIHSVEGFCLKNRYGDDCSAPKKGIWS